MRNWLEEAFYKGSERKRETKDALYDPKQLIQLAVAIQSKTMKKMGPRATRKLSLGAIMVGKVVSASQSQWAHRCSERAAYIWAREGEGHDMTSLIEEIHYQSVLDSQGVRREDAPPLHPAGVRRVGQKRKRTD